LANGTTRFWAATISVCIAVLTAGFWVITAVGEVRADVSVLTERVENLSDHVEESMDDRFRGADWRANKQWLDAEISMLKARLEVLER